MITVSGSSGWKMSLPLKSLSCDGGDNTELRAWVWESPRNTGGKVRTGVGELLTK